MRLIKYFFHPYTLAIWFCCILVIGKSMSGFYAFYILLGLPNYAAYAVLAVAGIAVILLSQQGIRFGRHVGIFTSIQIIGVLLLLISLYIFFKGSATYNYQTFGLFLPVFTLVVFAILVIGYLIMVFNANVAKDKYDLER